MFKAVINGRIVTENSIMNGDIIMDEAGKIADILPSGAGEQQYDIGEFVDAQGCYVFPGGIDGHVHFGGFGEIPIADDFYTGSRAALAGGTTTVVDFCESTPGENPMDCIARRKQDGESSMVDYTFHYTFTKDYKIQLPCLDKIVQEGITAFKAYTYYDNTALQLSDFREIMAAIAERGTLLIHAEEKTIIDMEKTKVPADEKENMLHLSLTRPAVTEEIAVEGVLALAKERGAKICIAHTSAGRTADIHKREREREQGNDTFLLETCPHYLQLTREKLKGPEGALYTMNPPLRGSEDNERLWQAVLQGDIAILSTDHCPYLKRYKFGHDFLSVPCGVDGVQTRVIYLFSEGVMKRHLPVTEFARFMATNAAKFYNLYPRKGVIAKGSDADLVLIDPSAAWTWSADSIAGETDYSVLDGLELKGKIACVIKGGKVAAKDGVVTAEKGSGSFLPTVNR